MSIRSRIVNAARAAARHLVDLGHRRIGYIRGQFGLGADTGRFAGYRQILGERDIAFQPELVARDEFTMIPPTRRSCSGRTARSSRSG